MASIRITQFGGLVPELDSRLLPETNAQIAHNCLLTNGSLRPQAQWVFQKDEYYEYGYIRGIASDGNNVWMYSTFDPIQLKGPPFQDSIVIGAAYDRLTNIDSPQSIAKHNIGDIDTAGIVGIRAYGLEAEISSEAAYLSTKPSNRVYAISRVRISGDRIEEGPLCCIAAAGETAAHTFLVFEGDTVTINFTGNDLDDNYTHVRLYRSISGFTTGQEVSNELDTHWHLIAQITKPMDGFSKIYIDGGNVADDPLDVYYAGQFHAPELLAKHLGLAESGWFVAADEDGNIAVSERYMHHAWPVENTANVPAKITDMVVHMDNIYIGTDNTPYIFALTQGEGEYAGVVLAGTPFHEAYECLPGSMSVSPSGAIYASSMGLIAIGREGQRVLTASIANAGDTLYSFTQDGVKYKASIDRTTYGTYYRGFYFGFCGSGPPEIDE